MNRALYNYSHTWLFYSLATLVPWSFWGIAAVFSHSPGHPHGNELASLLAFAGLLAPAVIALTLIRRNAPMRADLRQRLLGLQAGRRVYWVLAVLLMPASILLSQAISLLFGYPVEQFSLTGHYSFTSGVFPVWFLLFAAPVIEELAWHSYGTDCLCNRLSLLNASLLFALFWGLWHLPLSFIKGYYHSNLVDSGWIHSVNFLVSLFPFVIIINWLYFRTNRSVLSAMIFHVTAGYFNEIFATHPDSKVIQTGVLAILAAVIVAKEKQLFLCRNGSV